MRTKWTLWNGVRHSFECHFSIDTSNGNLQEPFCFAFGHYFRSLTFMVTTYIVFPTEALRNPHEITRNFGVYVVFFVPNRVSIYDCAIRRLFPVPEGFQSTTNRELCLAIPDYMCYIAAGIVLFPVSHCIDATCGSMCMWIVFAPTMRRRACCKRLVICACNFRCRYCSRVTKLSTLQRTSLIYQIILKQSVTNK